MAISIVATVRNESSTIAAFLDSLLNQSRIPDEIIIVDGSSTDGTLDILEDYANRRQIKLISQPCNIAEGRNFGIRAASASHIAVTDAGCRVDPHWLEHIASCFEHNPTVDVVAGNFRFETHTEFEQAVVLATFPPNRDETPSARYYPSSRSVAFTKHAWEQAGGYPEWLYAAEDTLFNIRLRQLGFDFVFCKDAVVYWRPRETWRALARQRINFARGNARVGIGTSGYLINLRVHGLIGLLVIASLWIPWLLVAASGVFAWHIHRHLFPQAARATGNREWRKRLLVLAIMEFVRLVGLYGFILGRLDRLYNPTYIEKQLEYMGVSTVRTLETRHVI